MSEELNTPNEEVIPLDITEVYIQPTPAEVQALDQDAGVQEEGVQMNALLAYQEGQGQRYIARFLAARQEEVYTPETDGKNHLNIGPSARTELGQFLWQQAYSPFEHAGFRTQFASITAMRAWMMGSGPSRDSLRYIHGENAVRIFRGMVATKVDGYIQILGDASFQKICANSKRASELVGLTDQYEGDLPIFSYEMRAVENGGPLVPVETQYQWPVEMWAMIRSTLQERVKTGRIDIIPNFEGLRADQRSRRRD